MKFESIPAWFWNLHSEIEESFVINSVLCIKHFVFTETTKQTGYWHAFTHTRTPTHTHTHTHTQSSSSLIHFQPIVFAQCRQSFTVCIAWANFPKRRMNKSTVFLPPTFFLTFFFFVHRYSCLCEWKKRIPGNDPIDKPAISEWGQNT